MNVTSKDLKSPKKNSNDLNGPQLTSKESPSFIETVKPNASKKNKLKGGGNNQIDDEYSDEIFHNNNLQKELAMQIISNAKIGRRNTVQDLKEFNTQPLSTQAKKGEQLVSMMPAIKKF